MTPEYEAIKAGVKEAVTEWLETPQGPEAIETGVKSAVLDWFELSMTGQAQIPWGTERAVTEWLKGNKPAIVRAVAEAVR
jgi:hypothetical protein